MNTKTDIQTLLDNGYTEDSRLAFPYEHQFRLTSFCGILLIFYPAIGVLLDNFFLLIFYGITGPLLGLIFICINIYFAHTGDIVSPSTGKKMEDNPLPISLLVAPLKPMMYGSATTARPSASVSLWNPGGAEE